MLLDERAREGHGQLVREVNCATCDTALRSTRLCRALAAVVMTVAASPLLTAQWINYPTSGVPRTRSGSPDLHAPAPRTIDGRPDLSGIWEPERTRPCPPGGCADMPAGEQFFDLGWGEPGGLPYQSWAAELRKERRAQDGKDDLISRCLPTGVPRMHTIPLLRKIIQVPGLIVLLNEQNASYRQIFTDGRPLPVDPQPSWNGYSTASWDGDVLVVQTSGLRDGLWLDRSGSPMTDAARVTERFHRLDFGTMMIEFTVDDPKAYTRPWTVRLTHFLVLDTDLIDYICLENEKDVQHLVGARPVVGTREVDRAK